MQDSDLILATFIAVFKADLTSTYSQTLVRLIARMTKERKFQIHPDVLSCLLHLRLHTELEQMVANKKADKGKGKKFAGRDKDKDHKEKEKFKSEIKKKWQTKNQKKKEKEMKEVEKDMKEAEAEIDLEERAQVVSPLSGLIGVKLTL
jgi:nucleolar complex protein 3